MAFGDVGNIDDDYYTGAGPRSNFEAFQAQAEERRTRPTYNYGGSSGVGTAIANELVKSYGLRHEGGKWSWSLENVAKSFKEDPIWTTLDYVLLAAPIGKVGKAAHAVSSLSKGTSIAKRAYQAGRFADAAPKTLLGKAAEALGGRGGKGFGAAVEFEMKHGLPKTRAGRFFSSAVTNYSEKDPDYLKFADELGRDPRELRGLNDLLVRERALEIETVKREAETLIRRQNRVLKDDDSREAFTQALKLGYDPAADETAAFLGKEAADVYRQTWEFRLKIHNNSYDAGLISEEAWEAGLKTYWPRVWSEYADTAKAGRGARHAGRDRFKSRVLSEGDIEFLRSENLISDLVLDPAVGMQKLAEAGVVVANQRYFQRLASSAVSRSADEVLEHVRKIMTGADDIDPAMAKAFLQSYDKDAWAQAMTRLDRQAALREAKMGAAGAELPKEAIEDAVRAMGWRSVDELFGSEKIPGYIARLPEELRGRFIDPAVADDIVGLTKVADALPSMFRDIHKLYMGSLAAFKGSKTAYNPPTHFRNIFGAVVFHHFTVGGGGVLQHGFFKRGIKALREGPDGKDWKDIIESGMVGSSYDHEIAETVAKALGKDTAEGGSLASLLFKLPILGDKWVTKKAVEAGSRAERFYRFIDEMAKVDAFLIRRDAWMKKLAQEGLEGDALRATSLSNAAADVAKFQPMFSQNSPFTNLVRNAIPFASFTTEAVRIWKNAMIEKPHLAFFWNHAVEAGSQVTAAMAGFSPDEVRQAEEAMPYFMEGKKTLVWPFRVNGKPVFLDMSYMIPMANIVEAEQADATFFDFLQIDPFTNPILSTAAAAATGVDPFSKQEVAPRVLERQFGVTVEQPVARKAVGLAEHMLKLMLPPLVPPGYSGVNLLEWARGERHPITGEELEEGALRTLGANLAGIRLYEADVNSQLLNVKREETVRNERSSMWWERWRHAAANGDASTMRKAIDEIRALRAARGDSLEDIDKYIRQGIVRREPGRFRTLSTRQIEETLRRSERLGYRSEDDKAMMGELMSRLQERSSR